MSTCSRWMLTFTWMLLTGLIAVAREPAAPSSKSDRQPASDLVQRIDRYLAERWSEAKVSPAEPADDAEFLRRIYLDLAGRIPTIEEARTFLDSKSPNRRAEKVEELLASPRYVAHFTNVWRALLIPEAGNNFQVRLQQGTFEAWLKDQVAKNAGYDQLARGIITSPLSNRGFPFGGAEPSPLTFYLAKEFKPENLAASTARVFLGISAECAQCHNHPFAEWKREQFWGFAAFFSGVKSNRLQDFLLPGQEEATKHEISMPGADKPVQAKFLDGKEPDWKATPTSRANLADWMTSPTNPYFARAAVNRIWAYFFGSGLIEPLNEMVGGAPTTGQPELLDLIAKEFVAHKFDVKFLIRTITATRAYQRSSAGPKATPPEPTFFNRMPLRGLTGEQLFDSVAVATGYRDSGGSDDLISGLLGGGRSGRSEFLTRFALGDRAAESQTSILQALSLMNGKVIADATTLAKSEQLAAVVDSPFFNTAGRVEALYLATLSRKPSPKESERAIEFVRGATKKAAEDDAKQKAYADALADLFWALLNNPEFVVNH
jgi:hypothetical protein